ncbi:MAG: tetratricopeptide repeat protein [Planctomycetes bacterium]|nr:tetratricopeptide repeat protein [Planctomycetota bacterium]
MPTINKRFLLKFILVVIALTGALVGVHAVQADRIPTALRTQAERAAEAGKLDTAIHYMRQYLEFSPDDIEAQVQLVDLLQKRNAVGGRGQSELIFLYDRILRLDPERHAIRREALGACLKNNRYSDAITHAEALLKAFPTEPALWQQLGAAQAGLNQLQEARKSYETAVTHEPAEILGYQRLAQLIWRNLKDPAGARDVLDQMAKNLPQSPEAHLIRARFEAFTSEESESGFRGDTTKAVADLQRVLELDPEHAEASGLLAELLQRDRKIAAAQAVLRDALSLYPRDMRLIRSLSWLEMSRGNTPAAIAVLEDGLKALPEGFDLLVPLADLLIQQGDTARTNDIIRRLESHRGTGPGGAKVVGGPPASHLLQVRYLRIRLAMRDSKWPEAVTMLESLRVDVTHLPALETQLNLLLAVCAAQMTDIAAEEKAFKRVTNSDPKNVQARVGLGNLYLTLGQFDEAVHELEAAAQSPYAAGSIVSQWIRTRSARLRVIGGSLEDWHKLELAAIASRSRYGPMSSEPVILQAELGLAMGKTGEAVQLLRKEAAIRPGDTRLWSVLARATAQLLGTAAGLSVVDEAQASAGDNADVRLVRAELYANEPGRVRPLSQLVERIESWPETEQTRLLFGMVEVFDSIRDQKAVLQTLRGIAARRPTDIFVWLKLHERALRVGDAKSATEARAMLVTLEGESGNTVMLCDAAAASPTNAASVLARLTTAFGNTPTRSDVCLALARLYRLTGNDPEARRFTERAFTLEPTRYAAAQEWLVHLCTSGPEEQAQQLVMRLGTDPRWMGDTFRRLVASVVPKLQIPVATKLLNWARPHAERDPEGLAWVAEVAGTYKLFDAVPLLEEATRRKGSTADDWLRLALARKADDLNVARGKIAPAAFLAAAIVLMQTPEGKDFKPKLESAVERRLFTQARLSLTLSLDKPADATKVLEDFLTAKDLSKADLAWGQRNLAMIYAVGGTPENRQKAMELIKSVEDFGTSPDELRATASVLTTLSRYVEGGDRVLVLTRAAVALNDVYKATNSPKDLFTLSQLYRAAGNRAESRKCLQILLNLEETPTTPGKQKPKNMYFLIAALEELVEDQTFDAAEKFAASLMYSYSGEFRAVAAVARYECKAGHPERALSIADGYARSSDPTAGDHLMRSARLAELLDELARLPNVRGTPTGRAMTDTAVERYAALIPSRTEALIGLVGVLAADGRATEAFAKIEQYSRNLPTRVRAMAGLAIVRANTVTDRQATTVLGWLEVCLAEEPTSSGLRMNRAEYFAIRQDMASAVADYQKVLENDPRNVIALNNLAWMMAGDPRTAENALEMVNRATREVGLTGDLLDTRARVRITLKQFTEAERDLNDAIRMEPTALRWFHLSVSRLGQTPPRSEDADKAFREAKRRGLEKKGVHPADRAIFDALDARMKIGG